MTVKTADAETMSEHPNHELSLASFAASDFTGDPKRHPSACKGDKCRRRLRRVQELYSHSSCSSCGVHRMSPPLTVSGSLKSLPLMIGPRSNQTCSSSSSQTTWYQNGVSVGDAPVEGAVAKEPAVELRHGSIEEIRIPAGAAMQVIPLSIFIVDAQGSVSYWSQRMTELTGYQLDDFQADPEWWEKLLVDCDKVRSLIAGSLAGSESSCNVAMRSSTGQIIRFNFCTVLQPSEDYRDSKVAIFVHDLDNSSPERSCLRALEESVDLPIMCVTVDGNVDFLNPAAACLSGLNEEDALGKSFLDIFTLPSHRKGMQEVLENAWLGKGTPAYELKFQSQYGEVLYLLANVSTRKDRVGRINGAIVVAQDVSEFTRHNRAVAATARELRQLLDSANAPIFGVDGSGLVNEWNDRMREITGFTGDEAFNKPFVEMFVAPHYRESVHNVIFSALQDRGTTNYELELRGKDKETHFLLVNATTRRDANANITGVLCISQDVTEASRHDRAVAAMASELRQLIDTANAPIFGIDCDGDINEWNNKAAEITGYTKEEAFDCSLVESFIAPLVQESVQDILDSALQGRGTSNYELEFLTKSNEVRNLLVNATTRRDAENNVVGVVGVAQDVTEAVQRDKAIAGMALELRQLIETANAPIFGIDIDGNINEWNRRAQEITGYSKEETFDEPLVERFIAPSMRQTVQRILGQALQGNETTNYELEFVSKSGEPRFMLVNATTRRDPEFNVVGVLGVAQDVTEDRKHAAELRKMQYLQAAQEAKVETERNMSAYFAHELRNPLSAIDSALIAMPDDLPESAKSLISGMKLCSTFMSTTMNNLLDVRKMEEGKMTLNVVPMSLEGLINSVHKMLLPSVKPGVTFTTFVDTGGRDWVLGDCHRIQQVLTNVLTNAMKYTVRGSIEMKLSWEGESIRFECIDSGPGIPRSEQEKLFQRFVKRGGAPGTGLGLAIAKHLVDLHHGSIRFDSDPTLKAGTTCIVLLPLALCDPPEAKEDEDTSLIDQPLSILIIDDVKMNRMMLKRRIMNGIMPNCSITEACTGEEALEICGSDNFDVIIVDQFMEEAGGVMVGTDVVYAMRRMRIDSIIIGCSGNDLDREFREAGADWVWKKPMPTNAEIIAHLRMALAEKTNTQNQRPI